MNSTFNATLDSDSKWYQRFLAILQRIFPAALGRVVKVFFERLFSRIERAGALDKLKQKSVWHVPPNQVEGMLQAVLIQM